MAALELSRSMSLEEENDEELLGAALRTLVAFNTSAFQLEYTAEPVKYSAAFEALTGAAEAKDLVMGLDRDGQSLVAALADADNERIASAAAALRAGLRRLDRSIVAVSEMVLEEHVASAAVANGWTSACESSAALKRGAKKATYGVLSQSAAKEKKKKKKKNAKPVPLVKRLRAALALDAALALAHEATARERLAWAKLAPLRDLLLLNNNNNNNNNNNHADGGATRKPTGAVVVDDAGLQALREGGSALRAVAGLWESAAGGADSAVATLDAVACAELEEDALTAGAARPPEARSAVLAALASRATELAQRCAIATAVATRKPPSLVARLCQAAAERAWTAHETLATVEPRLAVVATQNDDAPPCCLEALTAVFAALTARLDAKYGESIGWLGVASAKLLAAHPTPAAHRHNPLLAAVTEALKLAVNANSTVYFEPVPAAADLEPNKPTPLLMMKPERPLPPYDGPVPLRARQLTDKELARRLHEQLNPNMAP